MTDSRAFFEAVIGAGAIMSGFCGTFLAFRIQREANYYRQPVLSYENEDAKDIDIGLTHFTSGFLLLGLATLCSLFFGFLLPLLAIAGGAWALECTRIVVGGLVAAVVLLAAYFISELVHYRILSTRLANDAREWGKEWIIVAIGIVAAFAGAVTAGYLAL